MIGEAATVIVMNVAKGKRALRPLEDIMVKTEPIDVELDLDSEMFADMQPSRKRQRLDHLSTEEKIMRRKMKNRVAAQSARDRKKALMDDMEDKVRALESKLGSMEKRNEELARQNELLSKRNEELLKRLQERDLESRVGKSIMSQLEAASSVESGQSVKAVGHASSISVSLLKKQAYPLLTALLMMHCVGSMISKPTNCSTPSRNWSTAPMTPHRAAILKKALQFFQRGQTLEKWWGPQQRAWNPSKNS